MCSEAFGSLGDMKCFYLFDKEKNEEPKTAKSVFAPSTSTSISMSTDRDVKRSGSDFNSQNVSDFSSESSAKNSFAVLSQRQSNLRVFTSSELKTATKNFSRSLMIGEGGFGSVYRGEIRSSEDSTKKIDIAVKQLSRRGLQACILLFLQALCAYFLFNLGLCIVYYSFRSILHIINSYFSLDHSIF